MRIVQTEYGEFPEISHLNKRFVPGRKKQKITLDVLSSRERYQQVYPKILDQFNEFFPSLRHHDCCYQGSSPEKRGYSFNGPFKQFSGIIDVVHIIEHVVIDLQCSISRMPICSGITCHYWEPANRFDIFVECIDENVGLFSGLLAVDMIKTLLDKERLDPNYRKIVSLAKFLYQDSYLIEALTEIPLHLGWSLQSVGLTINELIRFKFLTPKPAVLRVEPIG
ncbi:MAG: hypothetical protein ONB05_07640 [candidate division KSB1 bacterium]|nr:hypothetical protein [candidate division KSB1 bacterium]